MLKNLTINTLSELETERWLNENSASLELYDGVGTVSRYKLYQVTTKLYSACKKTYKYQQINMLMLITFSNICMYLLARSRRRAQANLQKIPTSTQHRVGSRCIQPQENRRTLNKHPTKTKYIGEKVCSLIN
jgi:hypothetical protein